MAQLNFPDPNSTQVYEAGGLKWTWNDTHQVWSAEMGSDSYLSSTEDDTAAGKITFEGQTTHEGGIVYLQHLLFNGNSFQTIESKRRTRLVWGVPGSSSCQTRFLVLDNM